MDDPDKDLRRIVRKLKDDGDLGVLLAWLQEKRLVAEKTFRTLLTSRPVTEKSDLAAFNIQQARVAFSLEILNDLERFAAVKPTVPFEE